MKPVAILGSGPAALLAAHAVGIAGHPIAVFSLPKKSVLGGAQFLHEPIPGLTESEPDAVIRYRVRGNAFTYQRKVYGELRPGFVSFSNIEDGTVQPAWNLQSAYERLWSFFGGDSLNPVPEDGLSPGDIEGMVSSGDFKMIISGIPAPALCSNPMHVFNSAKVKIASKCMETVPENTVVYDGTNDRTWSRSSNLFGHEGTEWGGHFNTPIPNLQTVTKPLGTTCDCAPEVLRVGRMGTWTKGVLVNDAFKATAKGMHERGLL